MLLLVLDSLSSSFVEIIKVIREIPLFVLIIIVGIMVIHHGQNVADTEL
jgi:hypothetical protein